ncbi:glycosyltransferase family 4 protein [Enterococcus sp. ALS3]|uniref:Glycosyltransferase family 4 protein n=1 Tax=Enterococcus alishanensis TaxID=1303817 RepID=A0ABS6TE99_9ENTE|nr:glycosyltransferase family 4 protein [Enterococcus alishanensis]MBV7391192.1 glycosyltransferase family 4 protein [Enterococcus alishanensis]
MSRIIMVGPESTGKGGISTVIKNFIQYFPENNNLQIDYLFSWHENYKLRYALQSFGQLWHKTHTKKIAIVHFHVSQDASFYRKSVLLKAVKKGTKTIFHMHAPNFEKFYQQASVKKKQYIRKILDQIDLIVALSEEWAVYYQSLTKTEVIVIHNAVYVPQDNHYQAQSMNILTFGRICERKGSQDIVTVASRLEKKIPKLRFHLFGDTDETTVNIIEKIKQLDCKNIELHSWTTNQQDLLADCALHLLPSYHEGVPMAILETMAFGVPNLATDVGGIKQVLEDKKNGFLVVPGDVDQMEEDILNFFSNVEKRKDFSVHAKQKIEDHFSISAYFLIWENVYESLSETGKE